MEINITFVTQIIIFILHIIFCKKYIWPYVINIIERRKKEINIEYIKIIKAKNKILILKKKMKGIINKNKKIASNIILEAYKESNFIINRAKKKAIYEYKNKLFEAKLYINNKKDYIYKDFYKNINNIITTILIKITKNTFNKKLDNKLINKFLKKYK